MGKKKTTEEFKKEVYNLVKDEYEVLSEYVNAKTHITMKHNKCGHIYPVTPNDFLSSGNRCPECFRNKKRSTEGFKKEVYDKVRDEYEVLGEYINVDTHITMKHNKCGHIYLVTPDKFLNKGTRCPDCFGGSRKTLEKFKQNVYKKVGDEYEVLGKYKNNKTPIIMKHNKCGHIYPVTPDNFLRGNRCPRCNASKGELTIIAFLNKYNINYKHNKSYGSCYYKKKPLRFDFLIFDKEQNLKLICEFDGIQHFEPVERFDGEEGFKETKIRDNIKNEFCKDKEIPLLRIPYWETDNIHKILGKKLYKLGLISILCFL